MTVPPRPFDWITTARPGEHEGIGHVYIVDANGREIASVWGNKDEKIAMAEMIVEARNKMP